MGPKKPAKKQTIQNFKPFVSVCTPTFNRRPFIPVMFECFRNQTYPKDRMEWIIVDDGTDRIRDLVEAANIPNIKYFEVDRKMSLGEKRNYMHQKAKGSIIVYMDDDDYYPKERVAHAVEMLQANKTALCAGSSEMYIYFKHIQKMYQCGPYGPNHATAGTFAFKARLLDETRYEDHAALAEEKAFLKDYTVPFVQLDPMKTILVFSHNHNTFDKKKLLENPHPDFFKESTKTVRDFIPADNEEWIRQFFLQDIDGLLAHYEPGEAKMKPDVVKQTLEIEEQRKKMQQEMMAKQMAAAPPVPTIVMQEPGKPPRNLSIQEVLQLIQDQQKNIQFLTEENKRLKYELDVATNSVFAQTPIPVIVEKSKSEPDVMVNL
jgi:glycosyltransferase involved in cell wall biosynthesis